MTTIYLIRHAEAEGNAYRRIHGWYDALITDNGFQQIKALETRFQDIHVDAVYSSNLYRTMTTARAIFLPKNLELHTDSELRELHMGDWEDRSWGDVYHNDPARMSLFNHSDPTWTAPNGEGLADVGSRVEAAIRRIAQKHPDQTVAIFCHGTAIRQVLANVMGLTPDQWGTLGHNENTAVNCLTWDGAQFTHVFDGDASHLDDAITTMARQRWWRTQGDRQDVNLWYRQAQWPADKDLYLAAREEAWNSTHVDGPAFHAASFLSDVQAHLSRAPWALTVAMAGDEVAGLLQLDTQRYQEDGAGYIPFFYIMPQYREHNLGIQLIGQAVSFFRPLGRDKLRLRCAPYNDRAQHFYLKYGFVKIGEESGSRVPLDILEKYIGYQR